MATKGTTVKHWVLGVSDQCKEATEHQSVNLGHVLLVISGTKLTVQKSGAGSVNYI